MKKTILIIEDEKSIIDILDFHLKRTGYETLIAADGERGLQMALEDKPDLILLDVMLPKKDGFTVLSEIRKQNTAVPILMLTAREEENDKVQGLDLGADDYVTKPFTVKELLARIAANIRRTASPTEFAENSEVFEFGKLKLHTGWREVTLKGKPVELSQREYDLLLYLMRHAGLPVSREDMLTRVWNYNYLGEDLRMVDVAIRRLREKIEPNPAEPVFILTRRGAGYYFARNMD